MTTETDQARTALEAAARHVSAAVRRLAPEVARDAASAADRRSTVDLELLDQHQVTVSDIAQSACLVGAGRALIARADVDASDDLGRLALAYAGHVWSEVQARAAARADSWPTADAGADDATLDGDSTLRAALTAARDPQLLIDIGSALPSQGFGDLALGEDLDAARSVFREFAEDRIAPLAEALHRHDQDVPQSTLDDLAGMGFFGMGIPEDYGGTATGGATGHTEQDLLAMLVATEEVTSASMGLAGPFVTRPEILATALMRGGRPEQAQRWLPDVAAGARMVAVAVTEPDHGSDAANLTVRAVRDGDHYVIRGVKTWSTFAGRAELLLLMARTGTATDQHRGLSLFVVEKPSFEGHAWSWESPHGGRVQAQAIPTIGYRGMHSFEISFDDLRVPADCLIGGEEGLGRGFYLQMNAFANGRTQTAARAVGLMKSSLRTATRYTRERSVFGRPLADYPLTGYKLGLMACHAAACQAYSYHVAGLLAQGEGQLEASMVKSVSCRAAEWVTREAQQLHGGYGYAEEYAVSRHFLDARVLSLFEGAEETLALRVVGRTLLQQELDRG